MDYLFACLPILIVILLMVTLRWGGQRAGLVGWLAAIVIASLAFGLNYEVFWVSQAKGALLSIFVLVIIWPALLLYNLVDQSGGISAVTQALEGMIADRGILLIVIAWAFSGMLEGLAGFGLPVAIAAPILVRLGVKPVRAVAAVAVGHAWSVTFGDMGVVFQTLTSLVDLDPTALAGSAAVLLGFACVACGLGAALILKQIKLWWLVALMGATMGVVQVLLAVSTLFPLAAFLAGLAGVVVGFLASKFLTRPGMGKTAKPERGLVPVQVLRSVLLSYGGLTILMGVIALVGPLNQFLRGMVWQAAFPEVVTRQGFITAAGHGQVFRPWVHPGMAILAVALASYALYRSFGLLSAPNGRAALRATWRSALPVSLGIFAMVGISTLMDHTGMTLLLAQGLSEVFGRGFPLVSPLVGMLGAFATGSNNNSNVLFASLQQNVAVLLQMNPIWMVAAQTLGGSLGSMIAPAKLIVGCSTVGLKGRDGEALRITLPYGLLIGVGMGAFLLFWMR